MAYPSAIQYPSTNTSTTITTDPTLQYHVFASGLHDPEVSNILSVAYPQYYLTAVLDLVDAKEPVAQRTFSWFEQNRTRKNLQISSVDSGNDTPELTVTVVAGDANYAVVGDLYRTSRGTLGRVSSVTDSNTFKMIKYPTGNWSADATGTDIDTDDLTNELLGHVGTAFEEGSSAPSARLFRPAQKYNYTHIVRRTASVSGSELASKTFLGNGEAWFYENEALTAKEFRRDIEGVTMFGDLSSGDIGINATTTYDEAATSDLSASDFTMTRGIWDFVFNEGGQVNTYASASGIQEADLREMAKDLKVNGANNELTVLCGSDAFADIQVALKDYAIDGAQSYGQFGSNLAGLDFTAYKFFGITMNLVHYELFDDAEMLPWRSTNSSSTIDFRKVALFLDLGLGSAGEPLVCRVYRQLGDVNRDAIYRYKNGVTGKGDSMEVATGDDRYDSFFLSEFGIKVRLTHRHGILYANS